MSDMTLEQIATTIGVIVVVLAFFGFLIYSLNGLSKDTKELGKATLDLGRAAANNPKFVASVKKIAERTRVITCPDVAVITIANRADHLEDNPVALFAALIPFDHTNKDSELINVLGTVLKSNPKADLSPYEETFRIKIVNVDLLSPAPKDPPPLRYIDV